MHRHQPDVPDLDYVAVGEVDVPQLGRVGQRPHRPVVGVEEDRRLGLLPQPGSDPHVVIVCVRAEDRLDAALPHDGEYPVHVVWGVDHDALVVVAEHPDIVVDLVGLPIGAKRPTRHGVIHTGAGGAHRTTTDRSTSPWCIRSNAVSTSSSPIRSLTKASRSSRPCW